MKVTSALVKHSIHSTSSARIDSFYNKKEKIYIDVFRTNGVLFLIELFIIDSNLNFSKNVQM